MSTITVVTGANSGIGRATAIHLASQGHVVFGTVRSLDRAGKLQAMAADAGVEINLIELDVASDESVRAGFAQIMAATDGVVDVLVNNAGIGGNATVEDCFANDHLEVINVNLCGAVRCQQEVLPGMRTRRSGAIINVTSVVGRIAALAQSSYVTSKWALEGLSEQLSQEVARFGIRVAIVEPGITKTAIFAKNPDIPAVTGVYDDDYRRMFQMYAAGLAHATDPFEVGKLIHHAITTDQPKLRYAVSWGAKELIEGRAQMTDEQWTAIGLAATDDEYYNAFQAAFGLDLRDLG